MVAKTVKRSPGKFSRSGGEHPAPRIPSVVPRTASRDRRATGKGILRWYDRIRPRHAGEHTPGPCPHEVP
jgi:hypothetical protein